MCSCGYSPCICDYINRQKPADDKDLTPRDKQAFEKEKELTPEELELIRSRAQIISDNPKNRWPW